MHKSKQRKIEKKETRNMKFDNFRDEKISHC